jgi:DNA-binding CsgD family transcriptional regulator
MVMTLLTKKKAFGADRLSVSLNESVRKPVAALNPVRGEVAMADSDCHIAFAIIAASAGLVQSEGVRLSLNGIAADVLTASRDVHCCTGCHCMLTSMPASLIAFALPLRSDAISVPPGGDEATILLLLTDPNSDGRNRAETLQRRFGLTRAEATFLTEIIKGDGLQAAADRLGVSLATARTHLRHVFEKTGTHRQAELVGLAANGAHSGH